MRNENGAPGVPEWRSGRSRWGPGHPKSFQNGSKINTHWPEIDRNG